MITLAPVTAENISAFKEIRLRALRDAPYAFGSTHEGESRLTDAEWLARAARWNGERGIGFLAMDAGDACGIAGAFIDADDEARAQLVSMWTAPTHRRRSVGRILIDEIAAWARRRGARVLQLNVTSNNDDALAFYERLGFRRTGRTEEYPNDPSVIEYEMARQI